MHTGAKKKYISPRPNGCFGGGFGVATQSDFGLQNTRMPQHYTTITTSITKMQ